MKNLMTILLSLTVIMLVFSCQIFNGPDTEDHIYPPGAKLHIVKSYYENNLRANISEEYFYDDTGRISRIETPEHVDPLSGEVISGYQVYHYNDDGRLLSIASYDGICRDTCNYSNIENIVYQYDGQGNMIREDTYSPNDTNPTSYVLYDYDGSKMIEGKICKRNYNYYNDSLFISYRCTYYTCTYNTYDTLLKKEFFSTDSIVTQTIDYTYENGLKTKEVSKNCDGQISSERYYFYDVNRNLIKEVYETSWAFFVYRYEYYEE
jgi:hypothetical protein